MDLDTKYDRMRAPTTSGIPGARSQQPLPKRASRLQTKARRISSRSQRRVARALSCELLNRLLADSMILHDHYKTYHWLLKGHASRELQLLLDKHSAEQRELIDLIVERVQALGGVATGPLPVPELAVTAGPPKGEKQVAVLLSRLVEAHELIIGRTQDAITATATSQDGGTNELLRTVLARHEQQVSSVAEYLIDTAAIGA